jgi:hypothetical protein
MTYFLRCRFIPPPYDPANDMRLSTTSSEPAVLEEGSGSAPPSIPNYVAEDMLLMEDLPQPASAPENARPASPPQTEEEMTTLPDWLAPTEEPSQHIIPPHLEEKDWQDASQNQESSTLRPTTACTTNPSSILFSHYPFMDTDVLWRLPQEDISLLEQRRCFHLPGRPAIEDFMREFFKHVNPYLPTVDEADFWDKYTSTTPPAKGMKRISLFLIQSIMFAACPVSTGCSSHPSCHSCLN